MRSSTAGGAELRVGLVACCLNTAHVRGMGRYVQELLRQSASMPGVAWQLYGDDPGKPLRCPPGSNAQSRVFSMRGDRFHLWEQVGLPRQALRDRVDLVHCTEGSLPWWQPLPMVVTVHDTLAWEETHPSWEERFYFDRVLPAALRRSAAIVTISESSRCDIVARWPHLAPKITVIPHGIASDCFDEGPGGPTGTLAQAIGAAPYLVYLGGPMARKRFDWAVKVLQACPDLQLHLVACGFGTAASSAALAALPEALRQRVHFAPFLEDAELQQLYRGASAVLYPTLYEGFGFPVVEAHAAGVPCIFSALGSLAELTGPLAFVVEPDDLAGWVAALNRALHLGPERQSLAARAREWARGFSWQRSCEAHLAVYRQVVAGHRASR
jgi:alpha-1,3-rhamnosyl/mannosyltransferase